MLEEIDRSKNALDSALHLVKLDDADQITQIEGHFTFAFREKAKEIAFFMLDQSEHVTESEY